VGRRPRRGRKKEEEVAPGGEAAIVRKTRAGFVSWASVSAGLMLLDLVQGGGINWAQWVMIPWGAFVVLPQFLKLWQAGYSWRDILNRPAAPDAQAARLQSGSSRPALLPMPTTDEFGRQVAEIQQARSDRQAILGIMDRLPKSERQMLPDVVETVDKLLGRAEGLARMLHTMSADVDDRATGRIDHKIASTKQQPDGAERDRQLNLLERQRDALADLLARRQRVGEQLESCVLAMQNVRFDLLRLKSAGVAAVLGDLTQATQQARALSRDVDHAIAAAGEIRDLLSDKPPA
jgi:serine/threonine-protein kinase